MVNWIHVISAGTSVLRNFIRDRAERARELGISEWGSIGFDHPDQVKAQALAARSSQVFRDLYEYVLSRPQRASAELNAFLKAVGLFNHSPPSEVGIYLFSSDTGTGYLSASVVFEFLRDQGYRMLSDGPIKIRGLGKNLLSFEDSLTDLIDKVVVKILEWNSRGYKVYLNLTGGFKPESAYLLLAGALAGARRAYYIHESFEEVVFVPLPKLTIEQKLTKLIKKLPNPYQTFSESELEEIVRDEGLDLIELRDRGLVYEGVPAFRKYLVRLVIELIRG